MNLEAIKQEVPTKAQFELALKVAVAEYTQAAIAEGVTADKAQRLLMSRQGLELIAKRAALYL